ncbi:MAG: hypothetical protein JO108_01000 [Acidobacteriaceae bacterium]|nr:hypothetical protein [Acidobacteriaceae bacterium]
MASNQGSVPSAGAKVAHGEGIGPEIMAASLQVTHRQIVSLLDRIPRPGLYFIRIENLYTFEGQMGYVVSQGE